MYPHTHFIFGLIFALIGLKLNLINIYLASVLVLLSVGLDIDHLIFYYSRQKNWNLKKCWNYCVLVKRTRKDLIFHSLSFLVLITLAGVVLYFIKPGWSYVFIGACLPHYFLDVLFDYLRRRKSDYLKIKKLGLVMFLSKYELALGIIGAVILVLLFW